MTTPPKRPGRAVAEQGPLRQLTSFLTCRLGTPPCRFGTPMTRAGTATRDVGVGPSVAAHEERMWYRPVARGGSARESRSRLASMADITSLRARFAGPAPGSFLDGDHAELFSFRDLVLGFDPSPGLLRHTRIADAARDCLRALDGTLCTLDAFVILPTHAHLLFRQSVGLLHGPTPEQVSVVFKTTVEQQARACLGSNALSWEHEDFHRYLRTASEHCAARDFILRAPVRGGLVERPEQWNWLYIRPDADSRRSHGTGDPSPAGTG
jgi:hypothetical protein